MKKKIGIVTPYKGYNFGTSLQAYALKSFIEGLGFESYLIGRKNTISKGRDVSIKKLGIMLLRGCRRPNVFKKTFFSYKTNLSKPLSEQTKKQFLEFTDTLNIHHHTMKELKEISKKDEFVLFVCGSDQIWNATNLYQDPLYFLEFAPTEKRVSFAPSFGKSFIPEYNINPICRRIKMFKSLSCREKEGVEIISNLMGRNAVQLLDPTLLIKKEQWENIMIKVNNKNYILLYFLDEPNDIAKRIIRKMGENGANFITLNYYYEFFNGFDIKRIDAGPIEFLSYISKANYIYTDSFHGTALSINLHKQFFVFNRNYGSAENQSSRITSILEKCMLIDRYIINDNIDNIVNISVEKYEKIDEILAHERVKASNYLLDNLEDR